MRLQLTRCFKGAEPTTLSTRSLRFPTQTPGAGLDPEEAGGVSDSFSASVLVLGHLSSQLIPQLSVRGLLGFAYTAAAQIQPGFEASVKIAHESAPPDVHGDFIQSAHDLYLPRLP